MFKGVVTEAEALKTFNHRIVGMMADYGISMSEALWWDYEGFHNDAESLLKENGIESVEKSFEKYLKINGVKKEANIIFYRDIFTGKSIDLGLKEMK